MIVLVFSLREKKEVSKTGKADTVTLESRYFRLSFGQDFMLFTIPYWLASQLVNHVQYRREAK